MDVSPYVEYQRHRIQIREAHREAARAEALQAIERMQPVFAETLGLQRVYLFGSLQRNRFREDSDIDLAVEGVNAETFLRLSARLRSVTTRPVDLIDLKDCEDPFARFIREFGRVLYERAA